MEDMEDMDMVGMGMGHGEAAGRAARLALCGSHHA
jgi:hypothetical protein